MSRGRFERRRTLPKLSAGKRILLIVCIVQAILSLTCFVLLGQFKDTLITQSAAELWRGQSEERFAQISVFLPVDAKKSYEQIRSFRATLESKFVQNSMAAPEGASLYTDAFSGQTSVSISGTSPGSVTVTAIGVGGDFFRFHPLELLSGGYLSSEDYMADRVVLDAQTAFNLFGSSDAAGMEVTISGRRFPVAGVVKSETDFATTAALEAAVEDLQTQSTQSGPRAIIYMSYETLNTITELPIDCYEIVLPDPVSGFAKQLVEDNFPLDGGAVVQNTGRFSVSGLLSVLASFSTRVMTTNGVIYPYWENAARLVESYAALCLLLGTLLALMPLGCAVYTLARETAAQARRAAYRAARAVEERVEENKRRHYTGGGL